MKNPIEDLIRKYANPFYEQMRLKQVQKKTDLSDYLNDIKRQYNGSLANLRNALYSDYNGLTRIFKKLFGSRNPKYVKDQVQERLDFYISKANEYMEHVNATFDELTKDGKHLEVMLENKEQLLNRLQQDNVHLNYAFQKYSSLIKSKNVNYKVKAQYFKVARAYYNNVNEIKSIKEQMKFLYLTYNIVGDNSLMLQNKMRLLTDYSTFLQSLSLQIKSVFSNFDMNKLYDSYRNGLKLSFKLLDAENNAIDYNVKEIDTFEKVQKETSNSSTILDDMIEKMDQSFDFEKQIIDNDLENIVFDDN